MLVNCFANSFGLCKVAVASQRQMGGFGLELFLERFEAEPFGLFEAAEPLGLSWAAPMFSACRY